MTGRKQGAGRAVVIGIGNPLRSDDAAGLAVARLLREARPPDTEVIEFAGDPVSLIDMWAGARAVYLVDAVSSGGKPGTVYRFDAARRPVMAGPRHRGTHALGVADAIELARTLGRLPDRLVAYGIEGGAFNAGAGLSAQAEMAVRVVSARLLDELAGSGGRTAAR